MSLQTLALQPQEDIIAHLRDIPHLDQLKMLREEVRDVPAELIASTSLGESMNVILSYMSKEDDDDQTGFWSTYFDSLCDVVEGFGGYGMGGSPVFKWGRLFAASDENKFIAYILTVIDYTVVDDGVIENDQPD